MGWKKIKSLVHKTSALTVQIQDPRFGYNVNVKHFKFGRDTSTKIQSQASYKFEMKDILKSEHLITNKNVIGNDKHVVPV